VANLFPGGRLLKSEKNIWPGERDREYKIRYITEEFYDEVKNGPG
jgi:hypothetical protein